MYYWRGGGSSLKPAGNRDASNGLQLADLQLQPVPGLPMRESELPVLQVDQVSHLVAVESGWPTVFWPVGISGEQPLATVCGGIRERKSLGRKRPRLRNLMPSGANPIEPTSGTGLQALRTANRMPPRGFSVKGILLPAMPVEHAETTTGVPEIGTPVRVSRERKDYFSPISLIFTLSFRAAWAAASLAMGTR